MNFVMCPKCGKRLCKGEPGTKVEIECPKCGEFVAVVINDDELRIIRKPILDSKPIKQHA